MAVDYFAIFDTEGYTQTYSYPYIDGSLYTRDTSINWLFANSGHSLASLSDASIVSVADKQFIEYDATINKWRNRSSGAITDFFYTKLEVDALLRKVVGGTYP